MADSSLVTYSYTSPTHGGSQDPNIGVIHSIESPLAPGYARTLVGPAYFGGSAAGVSIHYLVDPVDTCQGMPENIVCYHVGGGNKGTIGIEQSGYARFSSAQWNTADGQRQMARLSALMADISRRRPKIALRWLTDAQLRSAWGNPGVIGGWVTHDQMRRVIGGTSHYDPWNAPNANVAWPADSVMAQAHGSGPSGPTTPTGEDDWLDMGAKEEILDALKNRKEGSQSVFDELRWAVNNVILPEVQKATAAANQAIEHSQEARRMLGVQLDWNAPQGPEAGGRRNLSYGLNLVVADDSDVGMVFAAGPGVFHHVPDPEHYTVGVDVGAYAQDVYHTNRRGLDVIQSICLGRENVTQLASELATAAKPQTYTVVAGDTLSKIAGSLGVSVGALASANGITNPDAITVGQVLTVPKA